MSKYKEIKGFKVQTLASDTAATKFLGGTWASGGSLPEGRSSAMGFGTQTASLFGSGYNGTNYLNTTFEYDGSSWTAGGDLTASAGSAREGHGVLTAGGVVAGYKTSGNAVINNYEQYDGTSFTEQADLNTARQDLAATGSTTAALGFGGTTGVGPGDTQEGLTNVESYNGSSWTEITEVNTGRVRAVSFPGAPAPTAIFVGGSSDSTLYANVETYNGSAWTEITDLNTARSALGGAGQAQTDGIVFGGSVPANTAVTENWNGTTWTELADLSTARSTLVGSGTGAASALATGGYSTTFVSASEEFTVPSVFTQTNLGQVYYNSGSNAFKVTQQSAPAGTWAAGGDLTRGVAYNMQGAGASNNAAIATGGQYTPSNTVNGRSEQYNGTSWTEVADLNLARTTAAGAVASPYSNTLYFSGGSGPLPSWSATTEAWDNSSWTEVADLNSARNAAGGAGSSNTSAICISGETPSNTQTVNVEEYDGSSWTEIANVNDARRYGGGLGTATAALFLGGDNDPGTADTNELWNGSSWTEVNDMNTARYGFATGGSTTLGLAFGGRPYTANTEAWNGTSWTEVANLAVARGDLHSGGGSGLSSLCAGGYATTAAVASTEEFTAAASNSTITVS